MYPVLLEIGEFQLRSYSVMLLLAVVVALFLLSRRSTREGYDYSLVVESVLVFLISGFIGARLLYIILEWEYYREMPLWYIIRSGGLSFFGAFVLGFVVLLFWCYLRGFSFLNLTDLYAPYVPLGNFFGRIACFLNGCCYGTETDVPWAVTIPVVDEVSRHPVQLYDAFGNLLLFIILLHAYKYRPFRGFNLLMLVFLYSLLRFNLEFFRAVDAYWSDLTYAQVFTVLLFLGSGVLLVFGYYRNKSGFRV